LSTILPAFSISKASWDQAFKARESIDVGTKERWQEFLFGFEIIIFTFIPTLQAHGIVVEK